MAISRRDLILLLIGIESDEQGLGGMTRLQKLLFLLREEGGLREVGNQFEFAPYKAGPYSAKLYDDLEFLENLGFIESRLAGDAVDSEAAEIDLLSFEDLMGDGSERTADAYEERKFLLSKAGREEVERVLAQKQNEPIVDQVKRIKGKYRKYSLQDLLYHVYTKYPDWATESEIKDQVLRKKR